MNRRRDSTISKIFAEADRCGPSHRRTWIALADGDIHKVGLATMPQEPGTGGTRVAEALPVSA